MKKIKYLSLLFIVSIILSASSVFANCVTGHVIRLVGQPPDFIFFANGLQTDCGNSLTCGIELPFKSIPGGGGCGIFIYSYNQNMGISCSNYPLNFNLTWYEFFGNGSTNAELISLVKSASSLPGSGIVQLREPIVDIYEAGGPGTDNIANLNWYVMEENKRYPLVHTSTANNSFQNYTLLDNGFTNNNHSARIIVTPIFKRNQGASKRKYNAHNIGVFYAEKYKKWAIFYQDKAPMEIDARFNVRLEGNFGLRVVANANNVKNEKLYLDYPPINENRQASIYITASSAPFFYGRGGLHQIMVYNDHPVGVGYDELHDRWYIANEDGANMPIGAAFNLKLVSIPDTDYVHTGTAVINGNTAGNLMIINNPQFLSSHIFNNANQIIFVTHRITFSENNRVLNPHPIGIYYENQHWTVANMDNSLMPSGARFNIFAARIPRYEIVN